MSKIRLANNQAGVSIVMVLMGFALAGVISVAMMKMNEVGLKRVKTREAKDERREFLKTMTMVYLGSQDACVANFGTLDVSANRVVATIQDEAGTTVVTADTTEIGSNLAVGTMTLQQYLPEDGAAGTSTTGYCDLIIEIQTRQSSSGNAKAYGGNRQETIRLSCSVDQIASPSTIQSCNPSSSGTEDAVWNVVEDSGNRFLNWAPFNGSGGLIIGPPDADPITNDTAALNMNMTGNWLGDGTIPLVGTNINHSIKLDWGGVASTGESFGIGSTPNPATADTECFFLAHDWGGGAGELEYPMTVCPNQVIMGEYVDTGKADKRTKLQGRYSLMAKSPMNVNPAVNDFSHVSILTTGAPDNSYILSMNGFTYDYDTAGLTYDTENIDGNAAFMVKAGMSDDAVKWYMDPVDELAPNDLQVLWGDDDLYEIMRFEPRFNTSFGDKTNILPDYSVGATTGAYNWLFGERNQVYDISMYSSLIGENNSIYSTSETGYNFIFGFTNSIEEAGDQNVIFGFANIINNDELAPGVNGSHNFIFGSGNENYADTGGTALIGLAHSAAHDANYGLAVGEGARLFNSGEVSFGKFPNNISTPEEQSIFTIGGGLDKDNLFNNFLVTEDGHLEFKMGSWVSYSANDPVFPLTGYIIPAQTSNDLGGSRNSSWISNNLKVLCTDDGTTCDYFSYNTADDQYGFAAIQFLDRGSVMFYHRASGAVPSATATPGSIDTGFFNQGESGGNLVAGFRADDARFYVSFNNESAGTGAGDLEIDVTGEVDGAINETSDRRLKTKIFPLESMLYRVLKLNPVEFKFKKNNVNHYGFIAQEMRKVFPRLVSEGPGRENKSETLLGIGYSGLVAPLVKSLFELKEKLMQLFDEVVSLWERFENLESRWDQAEEKNNKIVQALCKEKIMDENLCP
ncbi:tail fiber domain-containing protein [Bacteriovoracaceae bacterium]|nr:tail fiber domain-containing protein [Bacteriovoracaceae bacterium]